MKKELLSFYETLRHTATLESIKKEFYSKAEEFPLKNSSTFQMLIVDESNNSVIDFRTYFAIKSQQEAKHVLQAIEEEMGQGPLKEEKKTILKSYINEISASAERIKQYFHLKNYEFLSSHLNNIIQNLTVYYLPAKETVEVKDSQEEQKTTSMKLKWIGGVASLGTLFRELSTKPYFNPNGPNLIATRKQIATFLFENFVDENDEPFSFDSLYTFVARSDKEAKRNKIPTDEIFNPKK